MRWQILFFILSCLIGALSLAADQSFSNCHAQGYKFDRGGLVFEGGSQSRLYILHNISNERLILHRPMKYAAASAGWDSVLHPNFYSAIVLVKPKFVLTCHRYLRDFYMSAVACQKVLKVCEIKQFQVKRPQLRGSSFWVSEDKSLAKLQQHLNNRLILPAH